MAEIITQTRIEDAIDSANNFLQVERGTGLDSGAGVETAEVKVTLDSGEEVAEKRTLSASEQVERRVLSRAEAAEAVLRLRPVAKMEGFYAPLSSSNPEDFALVARALPGYMVLVPAALTGDRVSALYPAVISEHNATDATMRLHVLKQAYKQTLTSSAGMILSAGGQSETDGIGHHGHKGGDGVEAEHFATIIAAGSDAVVRQDWQNGVHVNHQWRKQPNSSVTAQMSQRLFGAEIPQSTITISKQAVAEGKAGLLWHEGLRDQATGVIESATKRNALTVIQALGLEALKQNNPDGLDSVKSMVSA